MVSILSAEEFNNSALKSWEQFYGSKSNAKFIPANWYGNYKGKFRDPNTINNGSLDTCVETLLWDYDALQNERNFYIPRLIDEFPKDFVEEIKKDLRGGNRNPSAGYEPRMLYNQSSLQNALIPPSACETGGIDGIRTKINKSVPLPGQWCPSMCVFPYHVFEPHLNLCLKSPKKTEATLTNLYEDIIKLRYAEFLSLLTPGTHQFILGLSTAYGPDILEYPIRVLEILKRRGLLRSDTKLFDAISMEDIEEDDNGFEEIFENEEGDEEEWNTTTEKSTESENSSVEYASVDLASSVPATLNTLASSVDSLKLASASPAASQGTGYDHAPISRDEFNRAVEPSWKSFYGEETKMALPPDWYSSFRSQFPNPNNKNGILDTCINVILQDHESLLTTSAPFKPPSLKDKVQGDYKGILKCLNDAEPKIAHKVTPNDGYQMLMVIGKSFLQKGLVEPLTLDLDANPTPVQRSNSVPQRTDWCPSRCIFPFQAFQAHVHSTLRGTKVKKLEEDLVKLRYVEYISMLFGKPAQFVRGIATAYGPHLLSYPFRLLQILKQRNLLRPGTKLYEVLDRVAFNDDPYIDLFQNVNHGGQSTPENLPPDPVKPIFTTHQGSDLVPPPPTSHPSSTPVLETNLSVHTMSAEKFMNCVSELWNKFHGEGNEKPIPSDWYIRYRVRFPVPNNKDGLLGNCIATLLNDAKSFANSSGYKIPRLADDCPYGALMVKMINDSQVVLYSGGSYEAYMNTNKSLLQTVLCDPKSSEQIRKVIPLPSGWCPSQSVFPFPAFGAHVHWQLLKNGVDGFPFDDLMEVLKLRYVEYLSVLKPILPSTQQFLLGFLTAYGPNAPEYPIRILQILKRRGLLRPWTPLYEMIDEKIHAGKTYINVFPKSASAVAPTLDIPKLGAAWVSQEVRVNEVVKNKSGAADIKVKEKSAPNGFVAWRSSCDKALEKLCTDTSPRFNIPDSYYAELFQSYSESVHNHSEQNIFNLFILAVWTGTRLHEFQANPLPYSSSEKIVAQATMADETNEETRKRSEFQERPRLDSGAGKLLQNFGIAPHSSFDWIHTTFLSGKKLELEAHDRIGKEFGGERLRIFVKEFSLRICWMTEEEDIKISAVLIGELIEKKLISKPFAIHSLKQGVVKHLPELSVKLINVTHRTSIFLVQLFESEDDLCWFLSLTDDLRRDYFPVWINLLKSTVDVIKGRNSVSAVLELFAKTPDSHELLQALEKAN